MKLQVQAWILDTAIVLDCSIAGCRLTAIDGLLGCGVQAMAPWMEWSGREAGAAGLG